MATQVKHPVWLPAAGQPGASTFATLYALESIARASVASVIPIQAYELLQSEQRVSVLYTFAATMGLCITLLSPLLVARFARRWVYSMGVVFLVVGAACFLTNSLAGQIGGMVFRVGGATMLSITLNLYIMDHIKKADFMRVESVRMAWSMVGWTVGPTLGVVLYTNYGLPAAHAVTVLSSAVLLVCFWYYRLGDNPVIVPGKSKAANPLKNVGRFFSQPRLRLAWVIAFGRSCFWTTFFVYGPILMVVTGEGKLAGGLLVSAGNALLFTAIGWGWAGKAYGARAVMAACFFAMTATLFAAGYAGEDYPIIAGVFLLVCALFTISLDALGSTAFMRAVRVWERPQMTAVYRTYLDLSDLLPPLVYSIILGFFGLGSVFVALGIFTAICGWLTWRYLPKSM
ncbi:MAG TPA: MFS transporter [Rhizobiaceae bacterium]|nr:MFS transporter [Rhizobiaceae bacterium]